MRDCKEFERKEWEDIYQNILNKINTGFYTLRMKALPELQAAMYHLKWPVSIGTEKGILNFCML